MGTGGLLEALRRSVHGSRLIGGSAATACPVAVSRQLDVPREEVSRYSGVWPRDCARSSLWPS